MREIIILLICILFELASSQEILSQDAGSWGYRPIRKQNRQVPRFYICGAATWRKREFTPASQKCQRRCRRKRKWWGKWYCDWYTHCDPIHQVHHWTRINGLRFRFCHFQDWNSQFELQEAGNFNWEGMRFCPHGSYVYGMRTKLSQRDGLAGLILHCKRINGAYAGDVLIFDGEGGWRDSVTSGNFAVGFRVGFRHQIYGLQFEMAASPLIVAFNFQYKFPKDFNSVPIVIEKVTVKNEGSKIAIKEIQFLHSKEYSRIWQNDRGYLHGNYISQESSQQLTVKAKIGIPFLAPSTTTTSSKQTLTQSRREESFQSFRLGVVEKYKINLKQKDVVSIPPCTETTIHKTVFISDQDIPYILEIAYTNGLAVEYEKINGYFRGTTTGEVNTYITQKQLTCRT